METVKGNTPLWNGNNSNLHYWAIARITCL